MAKAKKNYYVIGYATYPSVKLRSIEIDPETGEKKLGFIKELLFGDYMGAYEKDGGGDYDSQWVNGEEYIMVHCRNYDGYIKKEEIQFERPLEVNFIDVGQGDGCHIVTPDDEHFLIDAGVSDNMFRFLKWRFNLKKSSTPPPPFTVVISHPDSDHYYGFNYIFDTPSEYAQQLLLTVPLFN